MTGAQPTGVAGSGGSLPAGSITFGYTWVDVYGDESVISATNSVTVTASQKITVTIPSLPAGVSSANGSVFVGYAPAQGFFAEAGLLYEGSRYVDVANQLDLPAYTRWDAKAGYRLPKVELTLAVTNLTNRSYYATSTGLSQIMARAPRRALLSAAYKF